MSVKFPLHLLVCLPFGDVGCSDAKAYMWRETRVSCVSAPSSHEPTFLVATALACLWPRSLERLQVRTTWLILIPKFVENSCRWVLLKAT